MNYAMIFIIKYRIFHSLSINSSYLYINVQAPIPINTIGNYIDKHYFYQRGKRDFFKCEKVREARKESVLCGISYYAGAY